MPIDPVVSTSNRTVAEMAAQLVRWFDQPSYVVALSGGVDSAVVGYAAKRSGRKVVALTAVGPSVAQRERDDAMHVAQSIGVEHRFVETHELEDAAYSQNDPQRCFHCKSHLFAAIRRHDADAQIVTGTNADDLGDYRPGLRAASRFGVRAPLADCGLGKQDVRALARRWELPLAEKPASPCLASRLAYGVSVTPERLQRVEQAEAWLREAGFAECRVRLHPDELARIEVPRERIAELANHEQCSALTKYFQQLGFRFVALDLDGFRSGNLNQVVPLELKAANSHA